MRQKQEAENQTEGQKQMDKDKTETPLNNLNLDPQAYCIPLSVHGLMCPQKDHHHMLHQQKVMYRHQYCIL